VFHSHSFQDAENYFDLSVGMKTVVRMGAITKYLEAGPPWWQIWMGRVPNERKKDATEFATSILMTRMGRIWANIMSRVNGDKPSRSLKREREGESDMTCPSCKSQLICPSCQDISEFKRMVGYPLVFVNETET
jgi:hypothetical protein